MSSIQEQVKAIVAEQLGVKEEEVTNDASFVDDLGADSLALVELIGSAVVSRQSGQSLERVEQKETLYGRLLGARMGTDRGHRGSQFLQLLL